jgi:L-threonylcarbamoyladenylate synthase
MPSSRSHSSRILRLGDDVTAEAAFERAAGVIARGGLVVYPTETVYGIGANAGDPDALERIAAAKGRGAQKPILVLVGSIDGVSDFAASVPAVADKLMQVFWPGPLTLVFAARPEIPGLLTAGTGTIGLRWSPHTVCRELIRRSGGAITSTSANLTGLPTPGDVEEIARQLGAGIDLYLDGGPPAGRVPSTVVDLTGRLPRIVREGAVARRELRPFLGPGAMP